MDKKDGKARCFSVFQRILADVFLLEGCANGICAGICVAGAYVDFFCGAGIGAVMVDAVGDVAGNTVVGVAGFAGLFLRIVHVHFENPFE